MDVVSVHSFSVLGTYTEVLFFGASPVEALFFNEREATAAI